MSYSAPAVWAPSALGRRRHPTFDDGGCDDSRADQRRIFAVPAEEDGVADEDDGDGFRDSTGKKWVDDGRDNLLFEVSWR